MRVDGRIRFEYATCGRGNFRIRKEKVADSKISGYVWTGPKITLPKGKCSTACQTDLTADEIDYLVSELEEYRRKNKILSEKLENKKLNY